MHFGLQHVQLYLIGPLCVKLGKEADGAIANLLNENASSACGSQSELGSKATQRNAGQGTARQGKARVGGDDSAQRLRRLCAVP